MLLVRRVATGGTFEYWGDEHVTKIKKSADVVTVDRRGAEQRKMADRRKVAVPVAVERRGKVNRRRQIDPTTCERDYSQAEVEFMHALDSYKRTSGRMFPTCSEVLEVLRGLGYEKTSRPAVEPAMVPAVDMPVIAPESFA
jgi:hypothetical protein